MQYGAFYWLLDIIYIECSIQSCKIYQQNVSRYVQCQDSSCVSWNILSCSRKWLNQALESKPAAWTKVRKIYCRSFLVFLSISSMFCLQICLNYQWHSIIFLLCTIVCLLAWFLLKTASKVWSWGIPAAAVQKRPSGWKYGDLTSTTRKVWNMILPYFCGILTKLFHNV